MIQTATFWYVLLGAVGLYWVVPAAARMWVLALASLAYIATLDLTVALTLVGWTVLFYVACGVAAAREGGKHWTFPALIIGILAYLGYFKYLPVILHNLDPAKADIVLQLIVPLGISYFTFKLIHYAVEMKRGSLPEHRFDEFLCYIFLFPIYTAGPIERFDHFLKNRADAFDLNDVQEGITRIVYGLIKKFVIGGIVLERIRAEGSASHITELLQNLADYSPLEVWFFAILTYLLIYMDFSAYSDIAIGASRLFGIRIMENFDFPILAENISNFWKRWHMTLAGWCQAYVYMPIIGITRNPYLAVFATFGAIGMWHGASFLWLTWGLYHAVGVTLYLMWARYKRTKKIPPSTQWYSRLGAITLTTLYVSASFVVTAVHNQGDMFDALRLLGKLVFLPVA